MAESDRISAAARTNNRIRSEEVTTAERLVHPNVVSRRPRTVLQTSWDLRVRSCGRMAPSLSSGKWSNPRYGRSLRLLQGQLELLIPVCPRPPPVCPRPPPVCPRPPPVCPRPPPV